MAVPSDLLLMFLADKSSVNPCDGLKTPPIRFRRLLWRPGYVLTVLLSLHSFSHASPAAEVIMAIAPDEEIIAYMKAHPHDTLVPNIIAASVICGVLATTCVVLRLTARRLSHTKIDLSDWMIVASWVLFMTLNVCWTLSTRYGVGRHILYATNMRMVHIVSSTLSLSSDQNRVMLQHKFISYDDIRSAP